MRRSLLFVCTLLIACGEHSDSSELAAAQEEGGKRGKAAARRLSSEMPHDVNTERLKQLTGEGKFASVQRMFDRLSWQSFVALNWPVDDKARPRPKITDSGLPFWTTYSEVYEVFKDDGSEPDPYGTRRKTLPPLADEEDPRIQVGTDGKAVHTAYPDIFDTGHRVLHNLSSTAGINVLDEANEAFSNALWDRLGNLVHFEVLINQDEYDYIRDNELYNIEGQQKFSGYTKVAEFPSGQGDTDVVGAMEIKLAWRIMTEDDIAGRYLIQDSYLVVGDTGGQTEWKKVKVGLVGMHIAHKTKSSPQWIWSTFEHVDNLQVDALAAESDSELPKKPSFFDPDKDYLPVNVPPLEPDADGRRRTQVRRMIPIPAETRSLNDRWQRTLAAAGSVLQYYELVNTQWPTDPSSPPAAQTDFPESITNKSGGKPTPIWLINSVMETYFQGGAWSSDGTIDFTLQVQDGGKTVERTYKDLPSPLGGNAPASVIVGANTQYDPSDVHLVSGTESCMGCHSSSTLAVPSGQTGTPLSGDFVWILTRAKNRK